MQKTQINLQPNLYSDFAKSFKVHPLSEDLILNKNEMAVREALINIVFTQPGERFYSKLGVGIKFWLFEPMGLDTTLAIQNSIISNIRQRESRVKDLHVDVIPDYDGNAYNITITYSLINSARLFSVKFFLKRQR